MTQLSAEKGEGALFRAYVVPFLIFLAFSLLGFALDSWKWDHPSAPWYQQAPEMWIYPLQVIACAVYILWIRRRVDWRAPARYCWVGAVTGVLGIGVWLIPYLAGWIPNTGGFEPARVFGEDTAAVGVAYLFRFARAVLIVPIVEEFFWRGYLMRWCINRDFPQDVPFGQGSVLSYVVVTAAFMLAHNPVDYAGAFVYGSLAYLLVIRTRCLLPVLIMHAVANLIMGACAVLMDLPQLW